MNTQNTLWHRGAHNLCSRSCPVDHLAFYDEALQKPQRIVPDVGGLNHLNFSRTGWLNRQAVEYALQGFYDGLPPELQAQVDVRAPEVSEVFAGGTKGADALSRVLMGKGGRMRDITPVKTKEYSIWPINVHLGHWVLVVLHKEQRRNVKEKKVEWSHVAQMAIIDPARNPKYHHTVESQMRRLLERGAGCSFGPDYERKVWTPFQHDTTSCGPRAYQAGKTIMEFLQELHERGKGYHESLWSNHSGWFNEDFVRSEMMGRNAWRGVKDAGYNARIAVEIVTRVKPPGSRENDWRNAGKVMRPPDTTNSKTQKRPNLEKKESNTADVYMEPNRHKFKARPKVTGFVQYVNSGPSPPEIRYPVWPLGQWNKHSPYAVPRPSLREKPNPPGINPQTGAPQDTVETPMPGQIVPAGKRPLFPGSKPSGKRARVMFSQA